MEIPGYTIGEKIAEGGMATVYRAVQESLNRPVAIKILKETDDPSFSQRFLEEGRIIAALRHPNIITIYDIGCAGGANFISMELVEGGDLDDRIDAGIPPDQALAIIRKLADCLRFVHEQGIVHRDIKPGNILFRANGEPLLSDFGIAKQLHAQNKLTLDGIALGSPFYLSPEQSQCKKVDGRTDIYSLGIVLFEMLTGSRPFEGNAPIDTILMHLQEPLPRLRRSLQHLQPLVDRMTAKEPRKRYRDCAALLRAVDEMASQGEPPPANKAPRKRTAPHPGTTASAPAEQTQTQTMTVAMAVPAAKPKSKTQPQPSTPKATPSTEATRNPRQPSRFRHWPWMTLPVLVLLWFTSPSGWLSAFGPKPSAPPSPLTFDWRQAPPPQAKPRSAELERYLALAREKAQEGRLTYPENDCAWRYYSMAFRLDPGHQETLAGLAEIVRHYTEKTEQALAANAPAKAIAFANRGLQVLPSDTRLLELRASIGGTIREDANAVAEDEGRK